MVPVPVDHGSPKGPTTVDFLATDLWLGSTGNVVDTASHRFDISNFPGYVNCALANSFTVYTASQIQTSNTRNHLVLRLSNGAAKWIGDILVVKRSKLDSNNIVNVTASDIELVNLIVTW